MKNTKEKFQNRILSISHSAGRHAAALWTWLSCYLVLFQCKIMTVIAYNPDDARYYDPNDPWSNAYKEAKVVWTQSENTRNATSQAIGNILEVAETWVLRIGGVVAFIGAIMFALGWQREDAEGKTRGLEVFVAGALIMGMETLVAALV